MAIKKSLLFISMTLLFLYKSNAQSFFTVQLGNVIYSSSSMDADSLLKKRYAVLCNNYISKYCKKQALPIYIIPVTKDSLAYELSYDNLMGNSVENKEYNRKGKYDEPGLRILIFSREDKSENILKMLEYGLAHLKELKHLRRQAIKKKYYDRPDNLSINQYTILSVIKSPASLRVKEILKN